ncbi:unnamed protein product [Schistocephalus solidus]|uniref:Dynein light chain n=1 Tax=Schistocephalus solidus TaxID=70667 RepID=A0A183TIT4_SCHSO|nr:unnamed protein product [Schistocephalus solidus]
MMREFKEAIVQCTDMPEEMQYFAVDCAAIVLSYEKSLKKAADYVKKEFDKSYEPGWNCIIGEQFGSYVSHAPKTFIYFFLRDTAVLLYKAPP